MSLSVRGGLSGVAAAAAALGVAEIVALGTGPLSAPLLAVGGVVVDSVPGPVKDFGISVFGVHDKTALITGTAILLGGYAFLLGVIALRSWTVALGGIGLFAVVGVAAAVTRHDAGVLAALPSLVGAVVAVPVLRHLLILARTGVTPPLRELLSFSAPTVSVSPSDAAQVGAAQAASSQAGAPEAGAPEAGAAEAASPRVASPVPPDDLYSRDDRRRFLKVSGIVIAVAALGGLGGRLLTGRRAVNSARDNLALPAATGPTPVVPVGAQVQGAVPYVTPTDDFYRIDTALYPPQVDPRTWELRIHGMVRNPITITFDDLLKMPMVERYVTLACVSNEVGGDLIGNARWLGTPIKALLDEADPLPGADQVVQRSVDGWTCGTPTALLRDGRDALLTVGMNGKPLPIEHGFPVRMVVPGLYGYVSACKWITEIELTAFQDFQAYWVPRGWSALGPIKTQSRIDWPADGSKQPAGRIAVAGVAWAQHTGISKVELQVDGEPWQPATLAATVSSDTWRGWSWQWQASPGKHAVRVRATDTNGQTQTSTPAPPAPDGAQGWDWIQLTIE